MTTFSLLPAANTIASAISSGVNGSHPLEAGQGKPRGSHQEYLRIDGVRLHASEFAEGRGCRIWAFP